MHSLLQDIRYALRTMRKSWSVTAIAIATMALGIGANTAIFSVVNSVLLRPLPFRDSSRLVFLRIQLPGFSFAAPMNAPSYNAFSERQRAFDILAIYSGKYLDLSGSGTPERILAARASASTFPLLGISPALGRTFTPEEDRTAQKLVVLGYGLWQRRFGGDRDVIGRTIQLNREPYTIIGVMPRTFVFPQKGEPFDQPAEAWVPMSFTTEELEGWGRMYNHSVLARLKPGVTVAQAQADGQRAISEVEKLYPPTLTAEFSGHLGMSATRYSRVITGDVRAPLLLLLVAVAIVLLIACANVANLLLARATARHKEVAVRAALGADRWRLARQMISESMVLGVFSGGAGIALAIWGIRLLLSLAPADLPRMQEVNMDWRVLLFALALSLLTAVLFGITPALEATRIDPHDALKESGRGGGASRARRSVQNLLIVSQTALAVMLLVGAGLLVRSFVRLLQADPGFRPERVVAATVPLPLRAYPHASDIRNFWKELLARTESLPGIRAAGLSTDLPLESHEHDAVAIEGLRLETNLPDITQSWIYGDYFDAMGITLKRGRTLTEQDQTAGVPVVVISEAAAKTYWPGQDPIGKRMRFNGRQWRTVVGVVSDAKDTSLQAPASPHTYTPYMQEADASLENVNFDELRTLHLAVRTAAEPSAIIGSIREAVASLDPQLALGDVKTMQAAIQQSLAPQRFNLMLVGLFAVLAIFLAAVGVYGVLSYSVGQRTQEIGVRIAMGAQSGSVLRMTIGEGMKLALAGSSLGVAGGLVLTRWMNSLLYGVTAHDPLTFAAVIGIVSVVSLAACYIPARRAMRVDPIVALRYE